MNWKCDYVEWRDAYGVSAQWQEIQDVKPTVLICCSIGWVVAETEDCLTIVPHMSQTNHDHAEQQGCGDMTIPKSAIVRRVNVDGLIRGTEEPTQIRPNLAYKGEIA